MTGVTTGAAVEAASVAVSMCVPAMREQRFSVALTNLDRDKVYNIFFSDLEISKYIFF